MEKDTITIKGEIKISEIELIDERCKQLENLVESLKNDELYKSCYGGEFEQNTMRKQATILQIELEIKALKSIKAKVMFVNKYLSTHTLQISQESLNLVKGAISYNEQYLENIKKLPEKAVFVNVEKSILMLDIENTLSMLRKIKKEAEESYGNKTE